MPNINRYEPRQLFDAVRIMLPKASFFRDTFFPPANDVFLTNERAEWDIVTEGAPMARYINPRVPVEPTEREGFETREIATPYIQEARIITPDQLMKRQAGENIYSLTTPAERARAYQAEDVAHCTNAVDNRIELQCAQMMLTGKVAIKDAKHKIDDIVDYGLPNILTLAGTDKWDQSTSDPLSDLQEMFDKLLLNGYVGDKVFMSNRTFKAFFANKEIRELLDLRRVEMGIIAPEQVKKYGTAQYKGTIADPFVDIYTYSAVYRDPDTGIVTPYMPDGKVLMTSSESTNRMMFGAITILDQESKRWDTYEGRYILETFAQSRPASETTQVTSRPLPTPNKIDSWYVMNVI